LTEIKNSNNDNTNIINNTNNIQDNTNDIKPKSKAVLINYAALAKLVIKDLNNNTFQVKKFFNTYTIEDIMKFIKNPQLYEKQLRDVSLFLYNNSPQYKRLIKYFADLPKLEYELQPYNLKISLSKDEKIKLLTSYKKIALIIDTMNIKHEFKKIFLNCFKEDVFYGIEYQTKTSYFIKKLNPDYCAITGFEDGCYTFNFNFSYFTTNKNVLNQYPEEFKTKYEIYKSDGKKRWQEIDSQTSICIKLNEEDEAIIPFFANVFEEIFDIVDYKALKKAKEEIGNYAIIAEKIPIRKDSDEVNDFLIDKDALESFHNKSAESLPDSVGLIVTPFDLEVIKFDSNISDVDKLSEAELNYWSATGVNSLLFNAGKTQTSTGLSKSIIVDEQMIFTLLRQFERWLNRKLKNLSGNFKFKAKLLDITYFNEGEYTERVLKAAQYGVPVKSKLAASVGLSPLETLDMQVFENDILDLSSNWKPLQSSHTQSSSDSLNGDSGRPQVNEDDLSEKGADTRESDGNIRE
jgi:hypothetical protein